MRAVRFSRYGGPEDLEVVDVERPRPDTINDPDAAELGVHTDGHAAGVTREAVDDLTALLREGGLAIRIRERFPLEQVQDAYRLLAAPDGPGKIVLRIA